MKLPNAERAFVDVRKLREPLERVLIEDHGLAVADPVGMRDEHRGQRVGTVDFNLAPLRRQLNFGGAGIALNDFELGSWRQCSEKMLVSSVQMTMGSGMR